MVVIAVGGLAQPAFAHVEPDPGSVPAASTATITFNLEHGCEESDTVKLEMKLADGVTDATPAPIDGWTSSVADGVITWTGGPQPHDQALLIPVEMTFPNDAGQVLLFPLVQTCEQGEIRWVDPPNPDGSEPEDPAPAITLTAAAAGQTTTTSAAASTTAASTTAASTTARIGDHRCAHHGDAGRREVRQHGRGHRDRRSRHRRRRWSRCVAARPARRVPRDRAAQISLTGSARWPSLSGFTTMRIACTRPSSSSIATTI